MTRTEQVTDNEIMEANAEGMDAFDAGASVHDNPHSQRDVRQAWHDGWMTAQRAKR